jgi:predicted transglutaminase-like cysteine proteinase
MAFYLRTRAAAGCLSVLLGGLLSAPITADVLQASLSAHSRAGGNPVLLDSASSLARGRTEDSDQAPLVVALADPTPAALAPAAAKADVAVDTGNTQRDLPAKSLAPTPDGLVLRSARKDASRGMQPSHPSRRRGTCHRAAPCADPLASPQNEGGPTHAAAKPDRAATWTTPAPARFFTISEVLAKQKARAQGASSLQVAALDPAPIANDGAPVAAPARGDGPFGLFTFRAPDGLLWSKWRKVDAEIHAEVQVEARCRADRTECTPAAARFNALVDAAKAEHGRARLALVNERINAAIRYTSDFTQFGVADRWSSPLASLASGLGDCEDYAIAKYAVLRAAGLPERDLHVLLVRDNAVHLDHAVLAVREGAHWLILDNRWSRLTADAELHQFAPLFALGEDGVKLFAAPYAALGGKPGREPDGDAFIAGADASAAAAEAAESEARFALWAAAPALL